MREKQTQSNPISEKGSGKGRKLLMVNGLEQKMALRTGGGVVFEKKFKNFEKSACKTKEVGYNCN